MAGVIPPMLAVGLDFVIEAIHTVNVNRLLVQTLSNATPATFRAFDDPQSYTFKASVCIPEVQIFHRLHVLLEADVIQYGSWCSSLSLGLVKPHGMVTGLGHCPRQVPSGFRDTEVNPRPFGSLFLQPEAHLYIDSLLFNRVSASDNLVVWTS